MAKTQEILICDMAVLNFPKTTAVVLSLSTLFFSFLPQGCHGCFDGVAPLMTSKVWLRATGVQEHLKYEYKAAQDGTDSSSSDTITITVKARGRDTPEIKTLKCLRRDTPEQVFVEIQKKDAITGNTTSTYQCLRFYKMDTRVLLLARTQETPANDNVRNQNLVKCDSDPYITDNSVLVSSSQGVAQPCPLHGSFQAKLQVLSGGDDFKKSDSHSSTTCSAKFHFNCNAQQGVEVTLGAGCDDLPIHKNRGLGKVPNHSSVRLSCVGEWEFKEGELHYKTLVLETNDPGSSSSSPSSSAIWCLHYKNVGQGNENFQAYLSFDGVHTNPFSGGMDAFSENTAYGHLASYVSPHDKRCYVKSILTKCLNEEVSCSESNRCPFKCDRCYRIPKLDNCKLKHETTGSWAAVDSVKEFTVDTKSSVFKTSAYGTYSCRKSEEKRRFYVHPVVQYNKADPKCMPSNACASMYNVAPGVSTFYLRRIVSDAGLIAGKGEMPTCEANNQLLMKEPVPDPQRDKITLFDATKVKQPVPCEFGREDTFCATQECDCELKMGKCSGKSCSTLVVNYDNRTCNENPPALPFARNHQCFASLKFQDGTRGFITYSEDLRKYSCLLHNGNHRLFVVEPYMCNDDGFERVFRDGHAYDKYAPLKAFTIDKAYDIGSSVPMFVPHLYLIWICMLCSIIFIMKSRL